MNDSSNVDLAHAAVDYRDENDPLVEAPGVIADLNDRRVRMARAVKARGAVGGVAHAQPAPCRPGRPNKRKDRNLAVLQNDVEVRVVQDVRINSDGRTESPTNRGGVVVDGGSGNTEVGQHQGFGALGGRGRDRE